jgi:hypothetical protein
MKWDAIWEACKEPLRLLVLAIIPFGLAFLTEVTWPQAGVLLLVLRFIDKYLHEIGAAKKESSLTLGLTRF